jgi:uncharacterized protein YacL
MLEIDLDSSLDISSDTQMSVTLCITPQLLHWENLGCTVSASSIIEKTTNLKPTTNFANKFEYIPIITANIYADLFIIFATFSRVYYKILTLEDWYKKYRLSAMIADILIGVLYILLARYLVYTLKLNVGLTAFALLCVVIQVIFDFLFYLLTIYCIFHFLITRLKV